MTTTLRREDCETAVEGVMKTSDFILKDYRVTPFSDKTVGFMGRHFKITASVFSKGKFQEIPFFAKLVPTNVNHRAFVIDFDFFSKEVLAYSTYVPKLRNCLPSRIKFPVPKCFFARGTVQRGKIPVPGSEDEELIILEDVTNCGYRTLENFPPLDIAHCHVVVKAMARFHASSILLENSYKEAHPDFNPKVDLFAEIKENFLVYEEGHMGYDWAKFSAESLATAACKIWPGCFQGKREEMMSTLMEGWKRVFQMARTSFKYPNVLCHGDMWINNIMFAYGNDSNGKRVPVDAIFVDFQLVRYTPPIIDILLFLHVCTRRVLRDQHLHEFLHLYHTALGECLSAEFLDKYMPYPTLVKMFNEYRDFGRMMSMAFLPVSLGLSLVIDEYTPTEPMDIKVVMLRDRGDEIVNNCNISEYYKERILETYRECLEGLQLWN